jgi:hypothetical protein
MWPVLLGTIRPHLRGSASAMARAARVPHSLPLSCSLYPRAASAAGSAVRCAPQPAPSAWPQSLRAGRRGIRAEPSPPPSPAPCASHARVESRRPCQLPRVFFVPSAVQVCVGQREKTGGLLRIARTRTGCSLFGMAGSGVMWGYGRVKRRAWAGLQISPLDHGRLSRALVAPRMPPALGRVMKVQRVIAVDRLDAVR